MARYFSVRVDAPVATHTAITYMKTLFFDRAKIRQSRTEAAPQQPSSHQYKKVDDNAQQQIYYCDRTAITQSCEGLSSHVKKSKRDRELVNAFVALRLRCERESETLARKPNSVLSWDK